MKIKYFLYIIGIIFILSLVSNVFQYFKPAKIITRTETVDTTKIKEQLTAQITAELRAELKPEIITRTKKIQVKTNIDSIYEAAKKYWLQKIGSTNKDTLNYYNYIAEADTAIKDSLGWVYVRYNSQIPLPPSGYFNINMGWNNTSITHTINTIEEKKSFWDNFNYSLIFGPGVGLINKQFDIFWGIGISFNLKNIF